LAGAHSYDLVDVCINEVHELHTIAGDEVQVCVYTMLSMPCPTGFLFRASELVDQLVHFMPVGTVADHKVFNSLTAIRILHYADEVHTDTLVRMQCTINHRLCPYLSILGRHTRVQVLVRLGDCCNNRPLTGC